MKRSGRNHHFYKHGLNAGYTEYRYGNPNAKPITLAGQKPRRIFKSKAARDHVIGKFVDMMRDWRSSPFEYEGPARAGLRSALCLKGFGWRLSDTEAAEIVGAVLNIIGAERPTWDQGQREYVIPRENCARCGGQIEENLSSETKNYRFCSAICASSAIRDREFMTAAKESELWRAAHEVIWRSKIPKRPCEQCGKPFRPNKHSGEGKYCGQTCVGLAKRSLPTRECLQCGEPFPVPNLRNAGKFCSPACYHAYGRTGQIKKACECCGTPFVAKMAFARYCSPTCALMVRRFAKGNPPKRISPPVFDYMVRMAA